MTKDLIRLASSETRSAVLRIFFENPGEYYIRQLEKLTGYSAGNIRRELVSLESSGLLTSRRLGNLKLFRIDQAYPLYEEMRSIVRKTVGAEAGLRELFSDIPGVAFAFIYGSYASGTDTAGSDIDLVVIGSAPALTVHKALFEYQGDLRREINSIIYSREEFVRKAAEKDHFVTALLSGKKIFIKGEDDELRRALQVRKTRKA